MVPFKALHVEGEGRQSRSHLRMNELMVVEVSEGGPSMAAAECSTST